jgi:hypothetical protein
MKIGQPLPPNLRPQAGFPPLATFHARPLWWLLRHALGRFRRGKRRCPSCGQRYWDAYGFWWKDRNVRRWLCKWCGFYDGVDGRFWAVSDPRRGCWVLPVEEEREGWEEYLARVASGELSTPELDLRRLERRVAAAEAQVGL